MKRPFIFLILILLVAAGVGIVLVSSANKKQAQQIENEKPVEEHSPSKPNETQATLTNVQKLTIEGQYINPRWSPDGKKVLFSTEGNNGLFYTELVQPQKVTELNNLKGVGFGAAWAADGKSIFYSEKDEKYQSHVKSVRLSDQSISQHPELHFTNIQSYTATNGEGPILTLDIQKS